MSARTMAIGQSWRCTSIRNASSIVLRWCRRLFRSSTISFRGDRRAFLNDFGLSDRAALQTATTYEGKDEISSLVQGPHLGQRKLVDVQTRTGDDYCKAAGVEHIDLLKIDTEGAEPMVLRGFEKLIRSGRVDIIQFEYGRASIHTGFLLKDFYEQLPAYVIKKLYSGGVDFRPYDDSMEDFGWPNFIAVHKERSGLISQLTLR